MCGNGGAPAASDKDPFANTKKAEHSCRNGRKSKVARHDGELTNLGIWVANQRFPLFKGLVSADPYS